MNKLGRCFVAVLCMALATSGVAFAKNKEYKLSVHMEPQESSTWCAVSVVQAWVGYKNRACSLLDQKGIAYGINPKLLLKAKYDNGWSAGDVEDALEAWTGSSFKYHNHKSTSSAFDRIKKELKKEGRPLAISANACYKNGAPKNAQGHWMLVEGLRLKKNNKDFDGAYIKDPLYGSKFASSYETLRPRTWVRDLFTKWWIPNKSVGKEFRQSVED